LYAYITIHDSELARCFISWILPRMRHRIIITYKPAASGTMCPRFASITIVPFATCLHRRRSDSRSNNGKELQCGGSAFLAIHSIIWINAALF
jgi:hypothetical protein